MIENTAWWSFTLEISRFVQEILNLHITWIHKQESRKSDVDSIFSDTSRSSTASVHLSLSAGQMTDLIYTEKELVQSLREYIKAEESKLAAVKRYIQTLRL